ncbi:MAG: hypothetical protein HY904_06475 [Deltaproteobacteria bacterium]|nr:hypothetical protein [Deltaproteobacteria bacterium]
MAAGFASDDVESTRISVSAPPAEEPDVFASSPEVVTTETPSLRRPNVLVVDPGQVPGLKLDELLGHAGAVPTVVQTAAAAVDELKAGRNLVLFLVVGPQPGWATNLLQVARQKYADTPCVVVQPAGNAEAVAAFTEAGADDVLVGRAPDAAALDLLLTSLLPFHHPQQVGFAIRQLRRRFGEALKEQAGRSGGLQPRLDEAERKLAAAQHELQKREKAWNVRLAETEAAGQRSAAEAARLAKEYERAQAELADARQGRGSAEAASRGADARMAAAGAEVAQLKVALDRARVDADTARSERDVLQAAHDAAVNDTRNQQARLDEAAGQLHAVRVEVRDARAAAEAASQRAQRAEQALGVAEERAREAERRAQQAEERVEETEARFARVGTDLSRREKDTQRLQQQLAETVKECAQLKVTLARLPARVTEAERLGKLASGEAEELRGRLLSAEPEAAAATAERGRAEVAEARVAELQGSLQALQERSESLEVQVRERESERDAERDALDRARLEAEGLRDRVALAEQDVRIMKSRVRDAEDTQASAQSAARAAVGRADQAEGLVRKALAEADRQLERVKALSAELSTARDVLSAANPGGTHGWIEELAKLRVQLAAMDARTAELTGQLTAARDEKAAAEQRLQATVADLKEQLARSSPVPQAVLVELNGLRVAARHYETATSDLVDYLATVQAHLPDAAPHVNAAQVLRQLIQRILAGMA